MEKAVEVVRGEADEAGGKTDLRPILMGTQTGRSSSPLSTVPRSVLEALALAVAVPRSRSAFRSLVCPLVVGAPDASRFPSSVRGCRLVVSLRFRFPSS